MSIQWPSCFFNLCSSRSRRSNKRRRDCLLPPPRGQLCCRAGLTAPSYSHRCSSHPSTHPHLLLFSGDGRRTSKPSYSSAWETTAESSLPPRRPLSRPRRRPPPWCSRHGVVNVVNAEFHRKNTVREEADSWVHGSRKEVPPYYAQKNEYSPC